MERSAETTAAYIGSFLVNARRLKFGMILEGYLFFGTTLKFSRRKKRKTMSSQEGTNQSMAVLPIQLVSFLLSSFPFLSFFKVLSDNFMPGYDAWLSLLYRR